MLPLPPTDAERVAALRKLDLLDGPGNPSFDGIVRLVARTLNCSIAMISLMDEHRQWFLASHGFAIRETPRQIALCNYPVATGEPMLIRDACSDERFIGNPLVHENPRMRSYLGCPVRSPDGHILGTVCAADPERDKFGEAHIPLIETLSTLTEQVIAAHARSLDLEALHIDLANEKEKAQLCALIFRQMEKVAGIGAWEFDVDSSELKWSEGVYAIHGHPPAIPIDQKTASSYLMPEHRPLALDAVAKAIESGGEVELEAEIIDRSGTRKRVQFTGGPVESEQSPRRLVGVLKDITQRHDAHLALKRAAEIDDLTGLPNRNAFTASLEEAIRQYRSHGDGTFHLLMFDLDGLKDTNNIYGHDIGDDALAEIGTRLLELGAGNLAFARWGGDEFMLTLQGDNSRHGVHEFAGLVLETVARAIELQGKTIYLRATCGIAECEAGIGAKELIRRANQALRYGKTEGPGRTQFYDRSFEQRHQARKAAELEIRAALEGNRIFASYQPVIDLATGAVKGHEALLRIATAEGQEIAAAQLLPALVDPELSRLVATRMIALVASDYAAAVASGSLPGFVSINATEADLLSGDYPEMLLSTLAQFGVPPSRITLEVTETMLLVNDLDRVKAVLDRLKAADISIALDDFGTGFSSLTHLKVFPIDKVKIDRSFVCDIAHDLSAQSIVAAVIAMAQRLSIGVIAEGIENESQLAMLRQMDCSMGQGFLLSPPRSAAACRQAARAPSRHDNGDHET